MRNSIFTLSVREELISSSVNGVNWFMACPFILTLILPHPPLTLITLAVTISFSTCTLLPHKCLLLLLFFVMLYVPGTHYFTLLCHYLALTYVKTLIVVVLVLYCSLPWVHIRILLFMYPLSLGIKFFM